MNWQTPVYGTFHPGSKAALDALGKSSDGVLFADLPFNEDILSEEGLKMYKDYTDKFGPALSGEHFVTLTYAAFNALNQAILSKENVKDYLYKTKFGGIFGEYAFDKNGDLVSDDITYVLKLIKDGKVVR